MSTAPIHAMKTSRGIEVPLVQTTIGGVLRDTALETTVTQHYKNNEYETIEGIYTFPLPVGATLLSVDIDLNGKILHGTVVEKNEAQNTYEEAITDGNSALLLEKISDSMFTLNVGNLQRGDSAIVCIRYVQLLSWQQNTLRIMYPTTIADRYGRPSALGMQPHQATLEDPGIEHRADFSLQILGSLSHCAIHCPSHPLAIKPGNHELNISSASAGLTMDRDIIVSVERPSELAGCAGYYDRDLNGQWVAWLSLNPQVPERTENRNITIVVDCSGSMQGVSIMQAKVAVREIVEQLGENDYFNIIRFGSVVDPLFSKPKRCKPRHRNTALRMISSLEADMGGTNIYSALQQAYKGASKLRIQGDLLLITDGQSHDVVNTVKQAENSGVRHFTVGVGTAVAEDMVRGLAEESGGACELVSPNEDMADAIVRHVKRSYVPPLSASTIKWPVRPVDCAPATLSHAFSGDTLNLFARFDEKPEGETAVSLSFGEQAWLQAIQLRPYHRSIEERPVQELQLARLCAARRIKDVKREDQQAIGITYQLQTTQTSYVLVAEREEKDLSITGPAVRQVPQMMKADSYLNVPASRRSAPSTDAQPAYKRRKAARVGQRSDAGSDRFEIPALLRQAPESAPQDEIPGTSDAMADRLAAYCDETLSWPAGGATSAPDNRTPELFASRLDKHFEKASLIRQPAYPTTLDELVLMGMDQGLARALHNLSSGRDEAELVALVLLAFLRHPAATSLHKPTTRAIRAVQKRLQPGKDMEQAVLAAFQDDRVHTSWRL
ncbi:MAG: VIT domain-containing protein [Halioglobus sp.]